MKFTSYIYFVIFFSLLSCSDDWNLPNPQYLSSINCIVEVNGRDTSYAQYVRIRTPNDSLRYDFINDAIITLNTNNENFRFLPQHYPKNFNYKTEKPLSITSGELISLSIVDQKFGTLTSEEIVPDLPSLENVSIIDTAIRTQITFDNNPVYYFSGTLNIVTKEKHKLKIEISLPNDYKITNFGEAEPSDYFSYTDNRPFDDNELKLYNNEFFEVNDPEKVYRFRISGFSLLNKNSLTYIIIKISSVNDAFFRYAMQVDEARKSGSSPFLEPINIDTNIKNGYGIFGIQNTIVDTFYIK